MTTRMTQKGRVPASQDERMEAVCEAYEDAFAASWADGPEALRAALLELRRAVNSAIDCTRRVERVNAEDDDDV